MPGTTRTAAPALVAGATVALGVTSLALALITATSVHDLLAENRANQWLGGLAFGLAGALVLRSRPGNRLGLVLALSGLGSSLGSSATEYAAIGSDRGLPAWEIAAWASSTLWFPSFLLLLGALPLLFPDGALPSPRWRLPAWIALVAGVFATMGFWTTQVPLDDSGYPEVGNPLDLPIDDDAQMAATMLGFGAVAVVGAAAALGVIWRMRNADRQSRLQGAWFVAFVGLGGFGALLPMPDALQFLLSAASVGCLAVGIVRYRLFAIDVLLSRAVVYVVLTSAALAAYLGAAAMLGVSSDAGLLPVLLTAVVLLILAASRQRLQRWVDRALYGQRRDPMEALRTLGARLGSAVDDDEVLPAIVEGVRGTLQLPYAEVRFADESEPAAMSGERPAHTRRFELEHAGERVGVLEVGVRRGQEALSEADERLLKTFAQQAGVAAHGVRAARELRRSRQRVVLSREEERRRLRRELHDGLGPTLAGISLGLEQAERLAQRDAASTGSLLAELRSDTAGCVDEIRRIVADLRPPDLDQSGLAEALRHHAELLTTRSQGALSVVLEEDSLPGLPPAVEVAAYRIATEALTNVARHAAARTCTLRLTVAAALTLEIIDDGIGLPEGYQAGVGLSSMRERAAELGGSLLVERRSMGGTRVLAQLPLPTIRAEPERNQEGA
jgi:signal transduction histidine kinase